MAQETTEQGKKAEHFRKAAKAAEYGKSAAQLASTTQPLWRMFAKKAPLGLGTAVTVLETTEKVSRAMGDGNHEKAFNEVVAGTAQGIGAFFLPGGGILGRETVRAIMKDSAGQNAPDMSAEREFVTGVFSGKKDDAKKAAGKSLDDASVKEAMDRVAPRRGEDETMPGFQGMFSMRSATGAIVPAFKDPNTVEKEKLEAEARKEPVTFKPK